MRYELKRTSSEVDDVLNWAADAEDEGVKHFPGMSYEEGVSYALRWVFGLSDDNPMEDA